MANEEFRISVIICAYTQDRWSELGQAIQSIQNQSLHPSEIILVIDHNPALYNQARISFPNVKVLENQESRGLSGARNTGIAHSTGDLIAFMDEDAVADRDMLAHLVSGYTVPQVVGVGGAVQPRWIVTPPDWFPDEYRWVVGCSYKGLPQSASPVRNPIGCNMSFRREALVSAGGFRDGVGRIGTLPVGCEETELAIRIRQANPELIYLYQPQAVVQHNVPGWRLTWKYFLHRCYSEGLSKALVTRYVGSRDGLSSERHYVVQTLTTGVLSGLFETITHRKLAGVKRAAAIVVGLLVTTAGYMVGLIKRLRFRLLHAHMTPAIVPPVRES